MTCNSAADAPWIGLQLFHLLLKYEAINKVVSESAIKAFKNHLWYLTQEMVPIALFSGKVPAEEKRNLADSLLAIKSKIDLMTPQNRFGTGFGKPKFPSNIALTTSLSDLVGTDSWFLFHILQLDPQFLTEDVTNRSESTSYQTSLTNLQALNVVNDCAERGVKLNSDFLSSARVEEHYQNVLQVAEHDRKQQPNLRKSKRAVE